MEGLKKGDRSVSSKVVLLGIQITQLVKVQRISVS